MRLAAPFFFDFLRLSLNVCPVRSYLTMLIKEIKTMKYRIPLQAREEYYGRITLDAKTYRPLDTVTVNIRGRACGDKKMFGARL